MRIRELASQPWQDGKYRHAGHWYTLDHGAEYCKQRTLYHYSTPMLTVQVTAPRGTWMGNAELVYSDVGHGSVSDQQGCNGWFERLNLPYRYRRNGYARIESTRKEA